MKNNWEVKTLNEVIDINPFETLKKGIRAKKISMEKLQPYCRDIPDFEISEYSGGTKFRNGDTIMARITPCLENGKIAMVNVLEPDEIGFGSTEYIVFRAKENITIPDFVYYLICSPVVKEPAIKSMVGSSGRQRVQTDVVKELNIALPPYDVQKKISDILKALDDKIELNNKINNNLEQQISAIYNEKFSYILQGNTATIEQIIAFSNGKKRPYAEGNIPVYGGNGVLAYTNKSNSNNCIIIGRVGAYCGNVYYSPKECWVSDNAIEAKSKISDSQLFVYYLLKNAKLPSRHIGTGQPLMTQGILNTIPCSLPDYSKINAFNDLCEPLQQQIDNNLIENVHLAAIRESILPKLISGELDVSDINI